jgi:hypothetical protein
MRLTALERSRKVLMFFKLPELSKDVLLRPEIVGGTFSR